MLVMTMLSHASNGSCQGATVDSQGATVDHLGATGGHQGAAIDH
jgi:hypothetical protein